MAKKKKPSGRAVASGQEPAQPKRRRIGSRPPLPPKVSPPGGTRLSRWQRRLDQLREFKREHGHCAVPREHPGSLGTWVRWVRQRRRRGELSEERVRQLDVLGFLWIGGRGHASAMAWRRRIEQLKQFRKEHGHCIVPDPYAPDRAFGWWARNMRHRRRHGRLSEERFRQLDALGFAWVVTWDGPQVWEVRLRELRRYRKEQGHCQVPDRYPPNRALGRWARHLRTARKYGTLPEDKVRRLDTLGFAWDGPPKYSEIVWERHLEEFKRFRKEHGHLAVPNVYPSNRALGRWAHYLRQENRRGGLSEERVRQLDALGFAWVNVRRRDYSTIWLRRIAELKHFREKHGHCGVPRDYSPGGSLGRWADRIRKQKRDGTLSKERVRQLRAIGFCWDPKPRRKA